MLERPLPSSGPPPPAVDTALYQKDAPPITRAELPVRLKIPRIDVEADIEYVALTVLGDMGVPKGPDNAAWFALGPRPGEIGSSVIGGHFGWRNNIPAIFDDLNKLRKGDKIHTIDKKGVTATFIVRTSRTYSGDESTSGVFHSTDGKAHLNLITCKGTWNKAQDSYSDRLVVFTDKEVE